MMQSGSGATKRKAKSAAEQDVLAANGRYRRWYCYLANNTGTASKIKRQARRRERHQGNAAARRGED